MATEILKKQTIVGTDAQYEANRNSYGEGTVFESTSLLGENDIDPAYTNKFVPTRKVTNGLYLYAYDKTGNISQSADTGINPYTVARRGPGGTLNVGDPTGQYNAVNKEYADANYVPIKPSNFDTTFDYDTEGTYCFAYNGKNKTFTPKYKDFGLGSNNLPIYNDDATLTVTTPAMDGPETLTGNAASDTFVYNNFVLSEFGHTPSQSAQDLLGRGLTKLAYVADFGAAGDNVAIALSESPDAGTIALRTSSGQLSTEEPTETSHVANKGYVDNRFRYTHLIEVKFNPAPEPYVSYVVIGTITYTSNSSTPLTSIDQLPANVALPIHGKYQEDPTHFYETYTATRKTRSNGTSSLDITYLYYSDSEGIAAGTSGEFVPTSFTDTVV